MMDMFQYLFLTLGIELPVVLFAYRKEWKAALVSGLLINCFTWPILTLLFHYTGIPLLLLEAGVVITEAIAYRLLLYGSTGMALLVSFTANAASLLFGAAISGLRII